MHPQDLAFINDFNSQFLDRLPNYCNGIKHEGLYTFSPSKGEIADKKEIEIANKLRSKLYMIPFEVVIKKREFIKDHKFVLYYGFNNSARM